MTGSKVEETDSTQDKAVETEKKIRLRNEWMHTKMNDELTPKRYTIRTVQYVTH